MDLLDATPGNQAIHETSQPGSEANSDTASSPADEYEAPAQHTDLIVTISPDGLQALISLHADPPNPYPFTFEIIEQALKERGIIEGLLTEAIQQITDNSEYVSDFVVAQGKPVEEGEDARIIFFFDPAPKPFVPKPDAIIDWHESNLIQQVKESQPVARKIPPREGLPGITVTGKNLIPCKVRDRKLPIGRGTKVNEQDPEELLAATTGAVRLEINHIVVEPLLRIPRDVNFSIGNIDFNGSVEIGGNIQPGFRVKATGNIRIAGYVEGANVEAGQSLWVAQGILGQAEQTIIRAGKDIAVKFARNALICAGENIAIQVEAILCHIQSGGSVSVGSLEKKHGRIISGQVDAVKAVSAVDVGSDKEVTTLISITPGDEPVQNTEVADIKKRIGQLRAEQEAVLAEVAKQLDRKSTQKQDWTSSDEQVLVRLTGLAMKFEEELDSLDIPLIEEEKTEPPKLVVFGTLFPGVHLTIGHSSRTFLRKLTQVQAVLTDDKASIVTISI